MTQAEEYEALVRLCAEAAQLAFLGDGKTAIFHWGDESTRPLWHDVARAVLAVVSEKAKEPTERMRITWAKSEAWVSPDSAWRAMLAVSPLVKGGENFK